MPSRNPSAPFTNGFTLIELVIVLAVLSIIATIGFGISFNQYDQWMAFAQQENKLDQIIENRAAHISTPTSTVISSYGPFSESITIYENGELHY